MEFTCPHCKIAVEIIEINCNVFRCGILKSTGEQINPHLPESDCGRLVLAELIWGCGKPFKIENGILVACDYL